MRTITFHSTIMAAASMFRGRSSRRSKGRYDSGETEVPLDLTRDMSANIHDILVALANDKGVSSNKKLGHLNNFVVILGTVKKVEELCTPLSEIVACLRLSLIHSAKEVRGAGLRALRYLLRDESTLQVMIDLQVDILVMHCLDTCLGNEVERVQALRFIRRLITIVPSMCPMSLVYTLVSVANDGEKERDRLLRACLATLCELAVRNTEAFAEACGLATLIRNILDARQLRINESVMLTVLHLLNHPHTRRYIRMNVDLEQVIAPYTDFHYRHTGDAGEQLTLEEKENRYTASRMAIVTLIRSWPGMIRLCSSDATGLQSLLEILCIPNDVNRRHLLELLYDIFYLPAPEWTDDFNTALQSTDPCTMRQKWVLTEGFVVAEGKSILPHRAITRTNLTENQLALILLAFTNAGLLESLVEVITAANEHLSIMATLLLGELLHMADLLLPPECEQHHHCLPTLMSLAASFDVPTLQRNRASAAVSNLDRLHELKKRGPVPCSLFLNQILSSSETYMAEKKHDSIPKDKLAQYLSKDSEELVTQAMIKDTLVLSVKDDGSWNWELIGAVIKVISMNERTTRTLPPMSPVGSGGGTLKRWHSMRSRSRSMSHIHDTKRGNVSLKKFEDANISRFFRRLVEFYKPISKQFSCIELGVNLTRPCEIQHYSVIGCQLIDFLLSCEETEAQRLLSDLAQDIAECLMEITLLTPTSVPAEAVFSHSSITTTLSQDYFLLIGQIARSMQGQQILEKVGTFQYMLDLCHADQNESLIKLIVTSLQCSRDSLGRTVLSKVLKSTSDAMRLYATSHLRVLLRAKIPFFQIWGMELLVEQLYDKCRSIADEAVDIIEEACEDDAQLHSLVQIRPSLLHMGDKGALLLTRFLSTPKGFKYLSDANFVNHELEKWYSSYNRKYVGLVEMEINESFTCYKRPAQEGGFVRRSRDERKKRRDVYVPVHLYGQLVQHKPGCDLLEKQNHLPGLCDHVRYADIDTHDSILNLKAALWALGHIGTSTWGLRLLEQEQVIPEILRLAEESEVFSVRGTCFYVLGLISKTKQGAEILSSLGWECVRHTRKDYFPVLEEREHIFDESGMFRRDASPENPDNLLTPSSPSPSSPLMDRDRSVMSCLDLESPKFIIDVASPGPDVPKGVFFMNGTRTRSPSPERRLFLDVEGKRTPSMLPPKSASATQLYQREPSSVPQSPKSEPIKAESSETLYQKNPTKREDKQGPRGSILRRVQTMPAMEGPPREGRLTKMRSNSDASSKPPREETIPERGISLSDNVHDKVKTSLRERSQSLKNRCDSNESGRSSMGTKSRSESFATDTSQTSGVSSMYSNPSSPPTESSFSSINTVTSSQTVKGVHASDSLRKRHNLKRTPSYMQRLRKTVSANYSTPYAGVLETSAVFTTVRDAHGYAALKALRMQRQHSEESALDSKPLRRPVSTSISGDELSTTDRRGGKMKESYSMSCIEMNQTLTAPYSPGPSRSYKSGASQSRAEYIGLCLPVDTTLIFHTDESQYRGGRKASRGYSDPQSSGSISSPLNGPNNTLAIEGTIRLTSLPSAALLPLEDNELNQFSGISQFSEQDEKAAGDSINSGGRDRRMSSTRSEVETDQNTRHAEICLFCKKIRQKKPAGDDDMDEESRLRSISETGSVNEDSDQMSRSRLRGSSATSGRGTPSSLEMTSTSTGTGSAVSTDSSQSSRMREDTPRGRVMIRKEVLRFVVNMSSAVGMKAQESGLLNLRERFPSTFESLCLYSDVCHLLANCNYRLGARRFIQELFQDVTFEELYIEVQEILGIQGCTDPD